jgi:hypothetical protein
LLFTGGHGYGATFFAGQLHVQYWIEAPGVIRPERLAYAVVSVGRPDEQEVDAAYGRPTKFTRIYYDAGKTNRVAFSTRPGQAVWIGRDRAVRVVPRSLRIREVQLIEQRAGSEAVQAVSSLEQLEEVLAKLKAEPDGAANRGQPIRSVSNPASAAAGPGR